MPRILVTAFEPFGKWKSNASEICLNRLREQYPFSADVEYRVYPVEFTHVRELLTQEMSTGYDLTIHLGQTQQTSRIRLESVGLNFGQNPEGRRDEGFPLVVEGPVAYQSPLPLSRWAEDLRSTGIPAYVSYHAGTYLCNATFYWTHHLIETQQYKTESIFIHLPLELSQVVGLAEDFYTLPVDISAQSVARIIELWRMWREQSHKTNELRLASLNGNHPVAKEPLSQFFAVNESD